LLFFDYRIGAAVMTLSVTTLGIAGSFITLGLFTPLIRLVTPLPLSTTLTTCLIFMMVVGSIQSGVAVLLNHLETAWQREYLSRRLLEDERDLLEQRVSERTRELRQQALELQSQNAELDAFARTVAHDLKSPLTSSLGHSQMLLEWRQSMSPEQIQESLAIITKMGFKMAAITDALLLLARVRTLDTVPRTVLAIGPLVAEVEARLGDLIKASNATIEYPETWPDAVGYAPWVEEVLANYLSNGLKYGGTSPTITLGADTAGPECVRFWVRDNGPGLDLEQQARLFTPFTRLHAEATDGHGLGLSIVQRIIEKLGGAVGVESAPGQGSTFYFTLPNAI
jgi:two-component system, sensor histidine kinase and response regulator